MKSIFRNIDLLFQNKPCEIIFEVSLVFPYNASLETLLNMVSIWNMRLISAKSISPKAVIAIKYEKFLKLFGEKEKIIIGNCYKLKGTEKFITKLKLIKIVGNEKNECENTRTGQNQSGKPKRKKKKNRHIR